MKTRTLIATLLTLVFTLNVAARTFAQTDGRASLDAYLVDAEQGNATAQNEVGIIYAEGVGVKASNREGVKWFRKSAGQGNVYGSCNLDIHYGRGAGVRKNLVEAMKWSLIANSLDGLKCNPGDFVELFKPTKAQIGVAWDLAIAWLRAHPDLKNDFGDRPWLEPDGKWPVTVREHGAQLQLPIKRPGSPHKLRTKRKRATTRVAL